MTIVIFLIVLAVLIFVHELGHFLAARLFGIRVDAFAIGFGPKILSWKLKSNPASLLNTTDTEYSIRAIPFGGYVKIFGENPDAESMTGPDASRSFVNKPKWQQVIVLAAGVIFNFFFAGIIYIGAFSIGVTTTASTFPNHTEYFANPRIMIIEVAPDSPAKDAEIPVGAVIKNYDTVQAVQATIRNSAGVPIPIEYEHSGEIKKLDVTPVQSPESGVYIIGIAMENVVDMRLPIHLAIWEGGKYGVRMIWETVMGLGKFIGTVFRGTADFSAVSGPVGIAGIVADAAGVGFISLIMITAIISINLGVINFMPFPALDGGRILFVAIEAIIRRPIPVRVVNAANTVGFALLMMLMILVTYRDIVKVL